MMHTSTPPIFAFSASACVIRPFDVSNIIVEFPKDLFISTRAECLIIIGFLNL
jgi:hypothetical protein